MCIKSSTREGRGCAFAHDMFGPFQVDSVILSSLSEYNVEQVTVQ